jgi:hypothetical protein
MGSASRLVQGKELALKINFWTPALRLQPGFVGHDELEEL